MEKRKFKFLLGIMTCAFALSALAPIAAEETTQEPGEGTTVVEQTEAPETTKATETTEQTTTTTTSKELPIAEDIFEITARYGYDVNTTSLKELF